MQKTMPFILTVALLWGFALTGPAIAGDVNVEQAVFFVQ